MGVSATLTHEPQKVAPGGETSYEVKFRNTGAVVDQFTFQVIGEDGEIPWAEAQPPQVSLFPGAEGVSTIRFAPPRNPSTPAGLMSFAVRNISEEDPDGSVAEEGVLDIAPFTEVSAEL